MMNEPISFLYLLHQNFEKSQALNKHLKVSLVKISILCPILQTFIKAMSFRCSKQIELHHVLELLQMDS